MGNWQKNIQRYFSLEESVVKSRDCEKIFSGKFSGFFRGCNGYL